MKKRIHLGQIKLLQIFLPLDQLLFVNKNVFVYVRVLLGKHFFR